MGYNGSFNFEGEASFSGNSAKVSGSGSFDSNNYDIGINLSRSVPNAAQNAGGHASDLLASIYRTDSLKRCCDV